MRVALYVRVSTEDQTNDNQKLVLEDLAIKRQLDYTFYEDLESGSKKSRPGLDKMLRDARKGAFEKVFAVRVDRISRSLKDLLEIASQLGEYNISLSFVDQDIDISSSMGKAFFQILGAFAELERNMIVDRTKAGLRRARHQGKRLGRPPVHYATRRKVRELYHSGMSMMKIAGICGISSPSVHKIVHEIPVPEEEIKPVVFDHLKDLRKVVQKTPARKKAVSYIPDPVVHDSDVLGMEGDT